MTVLSLRFCARALSSCGKWGPLLIAVRGPLTTAASLVGGAQAPDAQAQQPWLTGPVAPWHVGSSQTRARTRVPCIGRQILNHCATREAPSLHFEGSFGCYGSVKDLVSIGQQRKPCRRNIQGGVWGDSAPVLLPLHCRPVLAPSPA